MTRSIAGRYVLHDELASGGMATVHIGRLLGAVGFSRTVAIKRLHPQFAKDPEFVAMFIDEARIAARIRHPNVVATLDTVSEDGELFLVMELVLGESLARLARSNAVPPDIAVAIVASALHGLHAAHEARDERGQPLEVVHRDISPQNILVGADGVARVLDFGVAKALGRLQTTHDGQVKGKVAYMAPEQLRGGDVDRRTDVYAASVVLWEILTGRRLFVSTTPGETVARVLEQPVDVPSKLVPAVPSAIDDIVMRGLSRKPSKRFATAEEMAVALEGAIAIPTARTIGKWVQNVASDRITKQTQLVARIDSDRQGATIEPTVEAPSHISVALETTPDARPRRRWAWIALPIALVALIGAISVMRRDKPLPAPAAPPAVSVTPSPSPTPSVEPPPIVSVVPAPIKSSAPKKPPVVAPVKKAPNCNPPFTLGPDGVHIPKKECK